MIDYYIKKTKTDDEECLKFLELKKEGKINSNIAQCYENIVTNYIKGKLLNNKHIKLEEQSLSTIIKNIKKIIDCLSPSFRDLKDSMNINDYIKIKIIKDKNFSIKVVDGFAMTKNVCSKKMREKQESPKILILDLDLNEHKIKDPFNLNNKASKGSYNIEEIKAKIESLEVNIILLNKGIGNLLLESLLKISKLIIIVNVKSSSLKKIARCTKGEVIYSLNTFLEHEVEKNNAKENSTKLASNIFGTCKLFQIINTSNSQKKKLNSKKYIIENFSSYNRSIFNNIILSNNQKLMIFDGCNKILFQTLLLYGENYQSLSEIKKLLKNEIFTTVREFFLEKKLLYFLFCNIPPIIKEKEKSKKNIQIQIEDSIQKINNNFFDSLRGVSNDMELKLNQNQLGKKNILKKKSSINLDEIINKNAFKNIISGGVNNENEIERKASENMKNRDSTKINISIISNSSLLNKEVNDSNNNINNIKTPNNIVDIDKPFNHDEKRNLSIIANISNLKYLPNEEKKSYHSSIAYESSNDLKEKFKDEKIESNNFLSRNKKSNSIYIKKSSEKSEKIKNMNNNTDSEFKNHILDYSKYYSNKIVSKAVEKQKNNNLSNFELEYKPHNNINNINDNKDNSILYQNGFDISPIVTNKTSLKLIRLTMSKGGSNLLFTNTIISDPQIKENMNKLNKINNSLTENALLKSLNSTCGNMEVINLIYYKSKYRENNKSINKAIMDMISEIYGPLEKMIINKFEEINKSLSKIIIDSIEEKDKYLSQMIIDMILDNGNRNIELIEEKDKFLGKQILDNLSENEKILAKFIIDIIAEKDKNIIKMIIDRIIYNNKPLDSILIDMIAEKDKCLGKKIIDILEVKDKPLCEKIIEIIIEKDKKLGKAIIDMITEKDKPLGKMIIDMTAEKENKCNKCKNSMNNHFYYLYNSNFSRIKIRYLSNSEANLEKIINFVDRKNEDFKKYYVESPVIENIDYNSDIYFYGYCKQCKDIVTPLIKMPKDLFNYSAAKFLNHIFNNKDICNRSDANKFNISSLIGGKKCNHSSFHDINRIFVTRYGSLKFKYEKLRKYDLISVQNILEVSNMKSYSTEINSFECIGIINLIKDNFLYELEELKKIDKIANKNNITFLNTLNTQANGAKNIIIELTYNLLNDLVIYLKDDNKDMNLSLSSINSISFKSDMDSTNIIEKESIEKKKNAIKSKITYNENSSSEFGEDIIKKDFAKLSNLSEKEKNFQKSINNIFRKIEDYTKNPGLHKRIFLKILQIKVLYNKIRSILNIIKIFISLELILKDEESKNKSDTKQNKSNNSKANPIVNNEISDISKNNINEEKKNGITESLLKSKTHMAGLKITDALINKFKADNNPNHTNLDLQQSNISEKYIEKSDFNNQNNNQSNNDNNDNNYSNENNIKNIVNEKNNLPPIIEEDVKCPFKLDPKRTILKCKTEIPSRDDKLKENKLNKEKPISNKELDVNIENEEKIELSSENLIKLLIDKYASIFYYNDIYKSINEKKDYLKMLETIYFYDEKQQSENSSIIKEKDLSSIVSYAISSSQYKTFIKEKTILLDIKRNQHPKDSDKYLPFLNLTENQQKDINDKKDLIENNDFTNNEKSIDNAQEDDKKLYNTLFIFDQSNIYYNIQNSEQKNSYSQTKKDKINRMLETEILCKESNHFSINISSLTQKKLECQPNISRKMTISRQTISNPMASPVAFSPNISETEKNYKIIENEFEQIENKISKFYGEICKIKEEIKDILKSNKLEPIAKPLTISNTSNIINNINTEELLLQNNNNSSGNHIEDKKKELLRNFVKSFNNSKNMTLEPKPEFAKKSSENEANLIEIIGKLYFPEDLLPQIHIEVIIYYPRQFEALRIAYCCTYEDLLISLKKSSEWTDVSGGKSKASFYKTNDEKYLFKSINKNEFNMFLDIAFFYFQHIDEYLFHKMPSVLMKILGVYKIRIKKTVKGETTNQNYYLMMMENLNYGFKDDKKNIKTYDLKGSTINRYVQKKDKNIRKNLVFLDSNFKKDFNNEPIPLEKDLYSLLLVSVYNDTLFLSKMGIVDYSLLLYINEKDEDHSIIRVGIIDYIRKYTWDKKVEHFVKTIMNGFNSPTIINPCDYKERFIAAIKSYFIGI